MASEAPVIEQAVSEQMETNLNNTDEASLSKPDDLNVAHEEEKVKLEDPASVEAPTVEPEQKEGCTVIKEVKGEVKDNLVSGPSIELDKKELKNETDVPNIPKLSNPPVEQPAEVLEASNVEDSVETPKEPGHAEIVNEEAKSVEKSAEVSAAVSSPLLTDDKPVVSPTICINQEPAPDATITLNANGTAENLPEGEPSSDGLEVSPESSKEELPQNVTSEFTIEGPTAEVHKTTESESSDAIAVIASVNEPKEIVNETVVPELPTEKTDGDHNYDSGSKISTEEEIVSAASGVYVCDTTPITELHKTTESENSDAIAVIPSMNEPKEVVKETIVPELPSEKTDGNHNADSGSKQSAEEEIVSAASVVKVSETTPTTEAHKTMESESSDAIAVIPSVNEPKEIVEERVAPELPTEKTDGDHNSNSDSKKSEEVVSAASVVEVSDTTPTTDVQKSTESESSDPISVIFSEEEQKEVIEETIVPQLAPEKTDYNNNADSGAKKSSEEEIVSVASMVNVSETTITTEVDECIIEPEINAKKEKQENTTDIEETTLNETTQKIVENGAPGNSEEVKASEGVEVIDQVKNASLEGEKSTLVETSRDINMIRVESKESSKEPECDPEELETEQKPTVKQTLLDKFVKESEEDKERQTAKVDDQSLAETTEDSGATKTDGEAPKAEIPVKKPKNIISKVKQSIVKVKKAIIGKSPSSKTMASKGIADTKA